MTKISLPDTTVTIVNASEEVGNDPQRVLFVGQMISSGTATDGALEENILDDGSEDTLFGDTSMLATMIRAARTVNQVVQFDAIGLDDNGTTYATGAFSFSGTATEDGTLTFVVASDKHHSFDLAITSGDVSTAIATNLQTLLAADGLLPVSSAVNSSDVDLTAINAGTYGNTLGLSVSGYVAGVGATVTAMSSGATDPDVTGVFDVVGDKRYQTVIWPYTDVDELVDFLDPRFNVNNDVLDGAGFVSVTDTLSNHLSRLGDLNSENLVEICDKQESSGTYAGPAQMEIPAVKASLFGSIRALRLTDGQVITEFVISANGALDAYGGAAQASKPYFNTSFANQLPLINTGDGFTSVEVGQLKDAGGTVFGNNASGTEVVAGEVVTTYKTDTAGNDDITFKYLNYRDTASGSREYFYSNLKKRFAQSRLTTGDAIKGRDQANAVIIAAYVEKLYQDLSGPEYVLVQAGDDAISYFKSNLEVTLDAAEGEATITMETPIVTQLRVLIATQKISFSVEG